MATQWNPLLIQFLQRRIDGLHGKIPDSINLLDPLEVRQVDFHFLKKFLI